MSRIVVVNHLTLDGVMHAPAGREEDTRDGFEHGGWAAANNDEVMGEYVGRGMAGRPRAALDDSGNLLQALMARGLVDEYLLVPGFASPRGPSKKRKLRVCSYIRKWRDPDSNRGHHDFQVCGRGSRTAAICLQTSQTAFALRSATCSQIPFVSRKFGGRRAPGLPMTDPWNGRGACVGTSGSPSRSMALLPLQLEQR